MRIALLLPSLLLACNTAPDAAAPTDTASADQSSGGYSFGSSGSTDGDDGSTDGDDGSTDGDDGSTDGDDGSTDSGTTVSTVTAYLVLAPNAQWEASLNYSGYPTVSMSEVANVTTGDFTGYGTTIVDTDASGGVVYDTVTYEPGQTLAAFATWNDGFTNRYFTESSGVVNSQSLDWDGDGDVEMAVAIVYADSTYDVLPIYGADAGEGTAYWHGTDTGGDLYIHTVTGRTSGTFDTNDMP